MSASPWTSSVFRGNKQTSGPAQRGRGGLARGLLLVLLPLILGPLVIFAFLIYRQVQAATTTQSFAQLGGLAELKMDQISNWANDHVASIANLANSPDLLTQVRNFNSALSDGSLI